MRIFRGLSTHFLQATMKKSNGAFGRLLPPLSLRLPSMSPRRAPPPSSSHGSRSPADRRPAPADGRRPAAPAGGWLYGLHPVAAALANPERRCRRLLVTDAGLAAITPALDAARAQGLRLPEPSRVERPDIDRLLPPGAVHQGIALDAAPLPEHDIADIVADPAIGASAVVVVLDQVTDPHNVGAILRSASAFGAAAVVVTERHAPEVTGVLAKSASGALEAVPLVRVGNLARALGELQQAGFWCVGLDEGGERTLAQVDLTGRAALVLGAEGAGLRRLTRERCDEVVRLPTGGPVASLNVSNAAAVALYEVARLRP